MSTAFVTGAAGYIGGSIATYLVNQGLSVRGLVRTDEQASALRPFGVEPIVGNLVDDALLSIEAELADIVVNTADADSPYPVVSLIEALRGTGKLLIHTSGSSVVGDRAGGEPSDVIHDDLVRMTNVRLEKQGRFAIDQAVVAASSQGLRSAVICPAMVYGTGLGLKKSSIQIPMIEAQSVKQGAGVFVGRGLNRWSNVSINDLCDLYHRVATHSNAGGFYFAESGEESLVNIARQVARARLGHDHIKSVSVAEAVTIWGPEAAHFAFGSNSRVRAKRARQELAWSPALQQILLD